MLSINVPFELNKESMILRNNDLFKHYDKLNFIKNRKNIYLPKIKIKKHLFSPNNNKSKISKNFLHLTIEKENQKFNNKINEINMRKNKNSLNQKIIKKLLKEKKLSRENNRKMEFDLLAKTNTKILNRIKNVHPIINHKELKLQYLETRKVYHLSRKLKPCFSWENIFTKQDYSYMEKFGNTKRNNSLNNSSSSNEKIKLIKIRLKKLGLSMNNQINKNK